MAEYNINFSTNASQIAKELSKVQAELAKAVQMAKPGGLKIQLSLDASGLEESINTTFRKINKAIESNQRKLSRLQIGGANFRTIAERLGTAEGQRERGQAIAEPIRLRAQAAAFEPGSLTSMQKVLQALRIEASQITPNTVEWVRFQQQIGEVTLELKQADKAAESIQLTQQLGALAPGSLSRLEKQLTILRNRARDIAPNTSEWKKLNKEIQNVETSIAKVNKKPMTMGQRAGAAGGAFLYGGGLGGGAGSALGGIAGGLAGGVPGAFTGAALGQLADNIGQALGATASYTAEIDKQRIALKNVTKDVAEYQSALGFIDKTSRDLAIPQDVLNKQFTQISASVIGAGGNVDAAKEAFLGIAAGIRGTGGSLTDMQGALLATSQVFSKGKVSAEELRQQIGERLPGAFTLFAKSMGKTPQELDKMLEQGQVTLNDFMGFVRLLSSEYGASASEIAASSQAAGDRLATTMSRMREAVGRELQPLGAQFQEILANAVADNEGNLVALASAFSQAAQAIGSFIEKYGGLIASLGSTVLLFAGTTMAVKAVTVAFASIGPAIATASIAVAQYGGVMATLKLAIAGLGGPITLVVAGLALLAKAVYDTNEIFRNFVDNVGGILASDFKNAVEGMAEDAGSSANSIQTAYEDLAEKLKPIGSAIEQFFEDVFGSISDDGKSSASNVDNAFTTAFDNILSQGAAAFSGLSALIGNWWNSLPAPIRNILGGNTASILVGAGAYAAALPGRTADGPPPSGQLTGMYGRYGAPESQVPFAADGKKTTTVFGGAGAGMSIDRATKEDKENKKKTDNLESFERLRDQLANAYNQAEIERIKAEYELRKRLHEDMYDMQEFGANRLQRQNLQFLRALAKAEQDRQDTLMDAQLKVAEAAGKIAPSAPILPSAGGTGGRMSIVDVGKALQKAGFTVKEHPAFGGVTPGAHSPRGYHPTGEAIDVTDWRGGDWKGRTAGLKQAMGGVGFAERLGPGDKGHETHVHLAVGSGGISQEMFNKALATITGQGGISAGAPRKVGSDESRSTMTGANVEIAQQNADIAERGGLLTKESTILKDLGRYMQEAYNVPDLTLDNQLLKARNDLLEQGVDENVINYKMRLLELDIQYEHLLKEFPKFAKAAKLEEEDRIKILAILAQYLGKSKDAEKAKNDETLRGIEIEKTRERDKYIKSLQDEIKLLLIIGDEERRLAEIKAQYGDAKAQEIFNLEKIKKNIEETRALIDGFVSSTTSDYKGFLKAVISGEDAADALKQFQEGLTDKVLTIFLDFAMAPVEKFLKESLEGLFLPKIKKEDGKLPEATTKDPVKATNINTTATNANTTEIKNLTAAIQGMGAGTNATSSIQGPTAGNAFSDGSALPPIAPGFDAASVFGNPEALTAAFAGIQSSISTSMEGITSSFQMGADSLANTLPSWSDSLTTALPAALTTSTNNTKGEIPKWQESLGKVTQGIGIAAGAIMGIAAGISQIKEGGTSNVLGGIGSVLMSLGGAVGGFAGFFKGANGGVAGGGWKPFPVTAFANGGMVTGPTLGLVGEGKYNEAIVPLPDGRSIPVQMKGAGGGLREAMGRNNGGASGSPILNMSFQSTNINGVEYVSRDQLEAAMAQTRRDASNDGAKRGMSMTLDKLQQSPSTRRKVGI